MPKFDTRRLQIAKLTDDYYTYLIDKLYAYLDYCYAIADEDDDFIPLNREHEEVFVSIKQYNKLISSLQRLIGKTRSTSPEALYYMEHYFIDEHRIKEHQQLIDQITDVTPLHNIFIGFDELGLIFKKIKAVASLRKIILDASPDTPNTVIYKAYSKSLTANHHIIGEHRNPCWDKFYNSVSIIIFPIAIARACHSLYYRGTCNFTLSTGEILVDRTNEILRSLRS